MVRRLFRRFKKLTLKTDRSHTKQTSKFISERYKTSNGLGDLLSLPNNRREVRLSFGVCVLLARSPSGPVAGQSECHQKLRQSLARDETGDKVTIPSKLSGAEGEPSVS